MRSGALGFGEFTLKSGRRSPYFFNSGKFDRGPEIERLGFYYASAVRELKVQPTVIFGPAYKGVPLAVSTAIAFHRHFGEDVGCSFDRKEEKDHGEGGWLVGKVPEKEDRIVLVDDVVTDGATKIEAIERLRSRTEGKVTGLVIALDRKERNREGGSSVESVAGRGGVEVRAIVTIDDILDHLPGREIDGKVALTGEVGKRIEAYLKDYGV